MSIICTANVESYRKLFVCFGNLEIGQITIEPCIADWYLLMSIYFNFKSCEWHRDRCYSVNFPSTKIQYLPSKTEENTLMKYIKTGYG